MYLKMTSDMYMFRGSGTKVCNVTGERSNFGVKVGLH